MIEFYNNAAADLPDHDAAQGPQAAGHERGARRQGRAASPKCSSRDNRRVWVPLADIPEHVQKAFIAAEDKRFYQHKGVDERGIIRAFIGNLGAVRAGRRAARPSPSRW